MTFVFQATSWGIWLGNPWDRFFLDFYGICVAKKSWDLEIDDFRFLGMFDGTCLSVIEENHGMFNWIIMGFLSHSHHSMF